MVKNHCINVNTVSYEPLVGFHQICNIGAVGDKDEMITF